MRSKNHLMLKGFIFYFGRVKELGYRIGKFFDFFLILDFDVFLWHLRSRLIFFKVY